MRLPWHASPDVNGSFGSVALRYRFSGGSEEYGLVDEKSPTAQILEYPLCRDQIKKRQGFEYVESAAVIQRLNDASGYNGWSFEILEQKAIEDEVITLGLARACQDRGSPQRLNSFVSQAMQSDEISIIESWFFQPSINA